jgi:hypothetical protein
VNADDYLFPVVRRIFKSEMTNKNLSSNEIQEQVHNECISAYEKMRIEFVSEPDRMEQFERHNYDNEINMVRELLEDMNVRELRPEVTYTGEVPTMSA